MVFTLLFKKKKKKVKQLLTETYNPVSSLQVNEMRIDFLSFTVVFTEAHGVIWQKNKYFPI